MTYLLLLLAFSYASLTSVAAIKLISVSVHPYILIFNLLGALFIFLYVLDYQLLNIGVFILFIAALLNGYFVMNRLTISHILTRLLFSLVLVSLNYFLH